MVSGFRNIYPDPIVSAHERNLVCGYPTYQELAKLMVPSGRLPNPTVALLVRRLVLKCCRANNCHGSAAAGAGTFSCAYCSYERQGTGGSIDAVHGYVVRAGIRHIGELAGRMDGYRGRRLLRSYRSNGR